MTLPRVDRADRENFANAAGEREYIVDSYKYFIEMFADFPKEPRAYNTQNKVVATK